MKCPKCETELRQSKKDPSYGLCDNCKKKFKLPDIASPNEDFSETDEDVSNSKRYSNIPPKHVRHKRESEMKKNYSDMLSINEDADTPAPFDGVEETAKPRKKKGIVIVVILLIILVGGAFFCYKSGIAPDLLTKIIPTSSKDNGNGKNLDYKAEKFELAYTDHVLSTDYEGNECLVVYFDFTNKGENVTNAGYEVNVAASQDGTTCEPTSLEAYDEAVDSIYLDVDPGSSIKIGKPFQLADKSKVTIEVSDLLGLSDETASQTLTIK